jgi:hypothetical protein
MLPDTLTACAATMVAEPLHGDTVVAVWWAREADGVRLQTARSDDGGYNWRTTVSLPATAARCPALPPAIGGDSVSGRVAVAAVAVVPPAASPTLVVSRSERLATAFAPPTPVLVTEPTPVAVALSGQTVAVVYLAGGMGSPPRAWLALSRDGGQIFPVRTGVSSASAVASAPAVAVRDSLVAVAWNEPAAAVVKSGRLRP